MSLRANLSSTLRRLAVTGVPTRCLSTSRLLTQQLSKSNRKVVLPQQLLRWNLERSSYHGGATIFQQPAANFHGSSPRSRNEIRIDESLNRLDTEIRRVGRIRRQEVDEILDDIKEMKKATSSQSLMIIRCCGELIPEEPPNSRTELVQQIWNTLEGLKVPMDVSHYNALLRVYLENEHKFNPTEFLQDLTSKGIEPNRVTYQRLIARFCQDGDIDGASTILQYMKEKQMPINEYVFNSLIMGHGQANDMESAEGILPVMRQAGLEPNDDTYVTLMTCYAKQGDNQNIHRLVKECEEKEIILLDRDFLSMIAALAESNHHELINEIIPYLKRHSGFNQEASNTIFRLTNMGHEESALKILKLMTPLSRDGVPVASGNFFIKHMIHLSRPWEVIVKYCKALQTEGLNNCAFSRACEFALMDKKFDLALELFRALNEEGLPIRHHYFWPMLAAATTEKEVYFALKCMNESGLTPNSETLRDYVIPKLLDTARKNEPLDDSLHKLSSMASVPIGSIASAAMLHLLSIGEMSRSVNFATSYKLPFGSGAMRRAIIDGYLRSNDASAFVKIIGSSCLDGDEQGREYIGMMLMELISSLRPSEKAERLPLVLKELLAHGLGLSNSGSELLQNSLGEALTPEIANTIIQLTSAELTPKISLFPEAERRSGGGMNENRSTAELEQILADAVRRNGPTKGIKKGLLYSYCRDRDVEKMTKLKAELIEEGFVFTPGMRALMLDGYTQAGKVEEAKAEYNEIKKHLDFVMDDLKILRFAHLLQTSGDSEGCLEFIKSISRDETRKAQGAWQQAIVWKLLNAVAEEGNPSKVKEYFNLLNERNLLPISNTTLGPIIKAYLVKDDLDGAVEEFERCVQDHKVTPWRQELFCRFIKQEDADKLQKVMDLSSSVYGEVTSMYDLVFAFIDCGKVRQAKKILDTPGLRARNDKLESYCQRYFQEGRVGELENLIQATKDLMDVDRNSMYFYLLQTYCKLGEADKALSLWTNMQEENVQPSVELLIYLADFLRKNDRPVPFVVPDVSEMISSSIPSSSDPRESRAGVSRSVQEYRRCIDMNEFDRALQIKQRIEAEGSSLLHSDISSLIEGLARAERLNEATRLTEQMFENDHYPSSRALRFLTNRLSVSGDVNSIEKIGNYLTPDLERSIMLNSRLCLAHVNAGRGEDYFRNKITKTIEAAVESSESSSDSSSDEGVVGKSDEQEEFGNIPVFGCVKLLAKNEHLLPEFEALTKRAHKVHQKPLNNALWAFHMSKKDFARAREVWETNLKNEERVLFRNILMDAKTTNDAELAMESVSQIMSSETLPSQAKGMACGTAMDVLVNHGRLDEAFNLLDSSLKTLRLEDYPVNCLINLKQYAGSKNKPFNYEIPAARREMPNRRQYRGTF